MENEPLIMAIDIGTTSVKCLIIDEQGLTINTASKGYPISSPYPNWLEQNPEDWWTAAAQTIMKCSKELNLEQVAVVSLSGHMSAPVLIGQEGKPLMPSILIADTRTSKQTAYLRSHFLNKFTTSTGNEPLDAFTASKLLWVKEEYPEVLKKATNFFFPKDYIRYKLTNKIGTDPTDAGNSLLFDLAGEDWNWEMINELGLPVSLFPELFGTASVFGQVTEEAARQTGMKAGTPVVTGGADMACSQAGTGATKHGTMAITLSTSGQIVMGVSKPEANGIGKVTYHPGAAAGSVYAMGSVFAGGLGVEWAYKLLNNKRSMDASDYEELARLTEEMKKYPVGSNGLLFLPFLVGSGSPHFNAKDRASWIGLTLNQDKALLLRSVLEGITYNIVENVNLIKGMGTEIEKVFLGAGGSRNPVWCKMIADALGMDVSVLANRDGSALGAAIIGGVGIGMFSSIEEAVEKLVKSETTISFDVENHLQYKKFFARYQNIYQALNEHAVSR
ncbi:xylulokinase [Planococcus shixiaomingii]|uniref:xylulokinase n=1 Tax=Planococcus shixiaomingii TaxID=3058393 RepID=UPI002606C16A|nr:xylulokinase [Planococcus sp. N022]WKA55494.1 xylulokinase [Planococcus sp. N022]